MTKFYIPTRRFRVWRRRNRRTIKIIFWVSLSCIASCIAGFIVGFTILSKIHAKGPELITPCPDNGCFQPTPTEKPVKIEPTTSPNTPEMPLNGKASYYTLKGCIGCRDDRKMANGEVLDDTRVTVAYNRAALNSYVVITNRNNGKVVTAKVTDRGGFENHGKIVDLSLATKNILECPDVCEVSIYEYKNKNTQNNTAVNLHIDRP